MTAPDLLPCPFCGGENVTTAFDHEQGDKWGYAGCDGCAARGPEVRTGYEREHDAPWHSEAIAAWNTRAPLDEALAEVARLLDGVQRIRNEIKVAMRECLDRWDQPDDPPPHQFGG